MWPVPSMRTAVAPGMSAAQRSAYTGGISASFSPHTTSVSAVRRQSHLVRRRLGTWKRSLPRHGHATRVRDVELLQRRHVAEVDASGEEGGPRDGIVEEALGALERQEREHVGNRMLADPEPRRAHERELR